MADVVAAACVGTMRRAAARTLLRRALGRGEIALGKDPDALADLVPALSVYRSNMRGHRATGAILTRPIDEVVLPLAKAVQP